MSDPVIEVLEEQLAAYQRLAKLAAAQHQHVQDGRTEELLQVLAQRQESLDHVARLEKSMVAAKRDWTQYRANLSEADRDRAEALLARTRTILEEITIADRNDALVLQQRKLSLGRQINQATAARKVNRAYAAAAYGSRPAKLDVQK